MFSICCLFSKIVSEALGYDKLQDEPNIILLFRIADRPTADRS